MAGHCYHMPPRRHAAAVKLLLDTGRVDIQLKDENGYRLLSYAAEGRHAVGTILLRISPR